MSFSMFRHKELICGLSRVVTIAVLPRLNMEELIFELNRRIQNLDKENSIKDRLVGILRDVMLEEYCQLERKPHVNSPDDMTSSIPEEEQETTLQENAPTVNAETMSTKTSGPDASMQSPGLDVVIKKESNDESSEVLMSTNELHHDTDQLRLTQREQLYNIPGSSSETPPSTDNSLIQMINSVNSRIKEEDFDMTTVDEAARVSYDELNIDTPTFYTQVLDTIKPMSNSCTKKHLEGHKTCEETPPVSTEPTPHHTDHSDVRRRECLVSDDDQARQICQPSNLNHPERYSDDRMTGFINRGQEQCGNMKSKKTPLAPCQPTPDQACDSIASVLPDNNCLVDAERYVCDVCGFKTVNSSSFFRHKKRHKGEKPFMCGECGYRAYDNYRLVEHMRKHTGEKPFKCDQCDYKASMKSGLIQHMKKHTDEEPYSCEICNYKTYKKSNLSFHVKRHTGEKPYKCGDWLQNSS
ncbi:zinc finger protein 260-like [Branchiostoma lanceolatum]|uniref:zinc finger protein 260-like n=1 Tax=Branchiostoma lanceolatum TaxID=7740 RepID=UPI0034519484